MFVFYKDIHCPICNGRHNLCMDEPSTVMTYRPHAFVCSVRHQEIEWHPDVFAHRVDKWPKDSIPLVPCDSTLEAAS
jgi:hypothetical protein